MWRETAAGTRSTIGNSARAAMLACLVLNLFATHLQAQSNALIYNAEKTCALAYVGEPLAADAYIESEGLDCRANLVHGIGSVRLHANSGEVLGQWVGAFSSGYFTLDILWERPLSAAHALTSTLKMIDVTLGSDAQLGISVHAHLVNAEENTWSWCTNQLPEIFVHDVDGRYLDTSTHRALIETAATMANLECPDATRFAVGIGADPSLERVLQDDLYVRAVAARDNQRWTTQMPKSDSNARGVPAPPSTSNNSWQCTGIACAGSVDGTRFVTADGLYYALTQIGDFIALRSDDGRFELHVRKVPWEDHPSMAVIAGVAARIGEHSISAALIDERIAIKLNGVTVRPQTMRMPNGALVHASERSSLIVWPDNTRLSISSHSGYTLTFRLALTTQRAGAVNGLLGNFDGDANDDAAIIGNLLPNPSPDSDANAFSSADTWILDASESLFTTPLPPPPDDDPTTGSADPVLATPVAEELCRVSGVNTSPLLEDCTRDVARTGQTRIAHAIANFMSPAGFEMLHCVPEEQRYRCINYPNFPDDALDGSFYELSIETLLDGQPQQEAFQCGPISPAKHGPCEITTVGRVFHGALVTYRIRLNSRHTELRSATLQCGRARGQLC